MRNRGLKQRLLKTQWSLNKHIVHSDFHVSINYFALCYKQMGNTQAYLQAKQSAAKMYKENKRMFDQYHFMIDQIFEQQIHKI